MFRYSSPDAQLFALIAAGVLSMIIIQKRNSVKAAKKEPLKAVPANAPCPYISRVQKVVASHADCTAEVFNIFVSGAARVRIFSDLIPGDKVELRMRDEKVAVYAEGKYMSTPLLPATSRLPGLLESDEDVEAYLGGRDISSGTDTADFCSIIAFYKIPGVPPTKVNIEYTPNDNVPKKRPHDNVPKKRPYRRKRKSIFHVNPTSGPYKWLLRRMHGKR